MWSAVNDKQYESVIKILCGMEKSFLFTQNSLHTAFTHVLINSKHMIQKEIV